MKWRMGKVWFCASLVWAVLPGKDTDERALGIGRIVHECEEALQAGTLAIVVLLREGIPPDPLLSQGAPCAVGELC